MSSLIVALVSFVGCMDLSKSAESCLIRSESVMGMFLSKRRESVGSGLPPSTLLCADTPDVNKDSMAISITLLYIFIPLFLFAKI